MSPAAEDPGTTAGGAGRGDRFEERVQTDHGPARLVTDPARHGAPLATLLLSHGAGGGIDAPDLAALAEALPDQGITVVRLEQPWRVAGRRVATAPPTLDAALRVAAGGLAGLATPLVVGGRSAGARSACRSAREIGAAGVVALSFPLHPPGRPEKSRLEELRAAGVPTLLVQGARDPMGRPEEFPGADDGLGHVDLIVVPGGDHALAVPARGELDRDQALALVVGSVLEWLVREAGGSGDRRGNNR